ncbi:daedalus isoform X2 [Haematobia irritans]|uniref:daedalus isoform X2 n=1 Tax=Haematobia irritans TaxID=7368 RepID=UPI003F503FA3
MEEHKNPFVSVNVPSVQFESNKEFQTKGLLYDGDSGFLRYRHKFIQPKGDSQANREILTTLLSTQGDNSSDYVEKLIAEDISYRDLASLTQEDLDLMGFNKRTQRELLSFFEQLPNQDPSYDQICHLNEAYSYNRKIVNNASQHLETMRSALAASNYKLQIMPPDDVIVGEKSFASRFVLEALDELYGVTDDIEKEMQEIEERAASHVSNGYLE